MDRRSFLLAAAAAPFALQLPGPLAYVTADLESHVAVVDVEHGTVAHRIATHPDPRSVERVGDAALVAHTISGRLSVVRGLDVRHVIEGVVEPRYTAAAADGRHAYVTDSGEPQLVTVDVERGTIVGRTKLKLWPRHLARHGETLVVALGTASPELAIVRNGEVRYRRAPFAVHDVAFSPDGRLWLTSGDAKQIWAGRVLPAGSPPQHVTFLGGRAYVTSGVDGTIKTHALDGAQLHEARVPVGSYNVQFGAGRVFTPSLSAGTLAVLGGPLVHVARSSHDACSMHE
jgi:DNA-binding beta-propeller fold protein YncE